MVFSKEQMIALKAFEKHFETAVYGEWARFPGDKGIQQIYDIFTTATEDKRSLRVSCGTCVFNLLRDCGKIYFKDKETVEIQSVEIPPEKKVAVKTTRKKKEK